MMRRGFSMVEMVVCVALLGLVVGFVLNLLPSSVLGQQRASDLSSASAYGTRLLDQAIQNPPKALPSPAPTVDVDAQVPLDRSVFHVTRTWIPVGSDGALWDVVVNLQGPRGTPLILGTRVAAREP